MNLSPAWVDALAADGHDAVHWREVGAMNAPDDEILSWAAAENRVVVTADLDFGTAVAMRGLSAPSIVQLRTPSTDPQVVGAARRRALRVAGSSLSGGAILTLSHRHVRLRPGPGHVSLTEDF